MLKTFFIFLIYFSFSDSAPLDPSPEASELLGPNCASEEDVAKISKCSQLLVEYGEKTSILNATDIKLNDTKILGFITLCKRTLICLEPTCLPEAVKDGVYMSCLLAEVKNTAFSSCANKIAMEKPDLSSYNCLKPEEYTNGIIDTVILESNPECLKTVLNGYCGEQAIANFDENVSKLLSAYMIAQEVNSRLDGTSNKVTQ